MTGCGPYCRVFLHLIHHQGDIPVGSIRTSFAHHLIALMVRYCTEFAASLRLPEVDILESITALVADVLFSMGT